MIRLLSSLCRRLPDVVASKRRVVAGEVGASAILAGAIGVAAFTSYAHAVEPNGEPVFGDSALGDSPCGTVGRAGAEPGLRVAPYLTIGEHDDPWLVWEVGDARASASVELYRDGILSAELAAERDGTLRRAALPVGCSAPLRRSLAAGTTLAYRVDGMSEAVPVTLPPCPDAPEVRFTFITDTQNDVELVQRLAEHVADDPGSFVLHGGDVVERGSSEAQWSDYHRAVGAFARRVATVPTLGNHERYFDADAPSYHRWFSPSGTARTWKLFSSGPVDVLVLDSEQIDDEATHAAQLAWLSQTLARLHAAPDAASRWRIVLTHHAPISTSAANIDWMPFGRSPLLRKEYVPLFERYGVDLVLAGHTHVYERSHKDGVHYLVGGTAGGWVGVLGAHNPHSVFVSKDRTLTRLHAGADRLRIETLDIHGAVIDGVILHRTGATTPVALEPLAAPSPQGGTLEGR